MKQKSKRYIGVCAGIAIILIIGVIMAYAVKGQNQVMTVNGETIGEEEYEFYCTHYRKEIEEQQKAGVDDKIAIQNVIVEKKVEQQLFTEVGSAGKFQYDALKEQMKEKNKENQEKHANGEPVYGLMTYDFPQFYDYCYNNALLKTKEKLAKDEFHITEQEKTQFYEEHKTEMFQKPYEGMYYLFSSDSTREGQEKLRQIASMDAAAVEQILQNGCDGVQIIPYKITEEEYRMLEKGKPKVAALSQTLEQHAFSNIIKDGETCQMMYCEERSEKKVMSYEEATQIIETQLIEKKYAQYLEKEIQNADVTIR